MDNEHRIPDFIKEEPPTGVSNHHDIRAERTRSGMRARAQQGWWPWRAPVGYLNERTGDGKPSLVIDSDRGPLLWEGFELFASGGYSQREVLQNLTARGLRTHNDTKVSLQTWNSVLTNPTYAAWVEADMAGPQPVRGNWEPLVSQETFDRVQAILATRNHSGHKKDRPDFPLRRFVRCAECNRPLTAFWGL